ncbi:MAG: PEP-CTERM sorting domain-containing protein [Edaphobacter sp.]
MKKTLLGLCALALVTLTSTAGHADTFSFSFTGIDFDGSGTFTATNVGPSPVAVGIEFDITGVTGSVSQLNFGQITSTSNITGLLAVKSFDNNDNDFFVPGIDGFFDGDGVSFVLANDTDVNLGSAGVLTVADEQKSKGGATGELTSVTIQDVSSSPVPPAVPEPGTLALFGTGVLGAAGVIRRRLMA